MTLEFLLVIPALLLVMVAGLQVVGLARARIELEGAAREGARVAATTPDPARAVVVVHDALPDEWRDSARISVSRPSVVGRPATVTIRVRHVLGASFLSGLTVELKASASMLVER